MYGQVAPKCRGGGGALVLNRGNMDSHLNFWPRDEKLVMGGRGRMIKDHYKEEASCPNLLEGGGGGGGGIGGALILNTAWTFTCWAIQTVLAWALNKNLSSIAHYYCNVGFQY